MIAPMDAPSAEAQIAGFLAKYTPAIEAQLREARMRLQAMFPRGYELVYDNYNALVFAVSPSERTRDAFLSIAGYPRWVTLFFLGGAELDDPEGLLQGEGKQVRGLRLKSPADISSRAIHALVEQVVAPRRELLATAPALKTVVKSVSAHQRSRRPTEAK